MQTTNPSELTDEDRAAILSFLKDHPIGVLATTGQDGAPNASAIYYSVDDDCNLYFTTKRDTLKHGNLTANPRVMLVAYDAARQASVEAGGTAVEVTDPEEANRIYHGTLQAAHRTGPDNVPPIAKLPAGPYVAYAVKPDFLKLTEYGQGDSFRRAMEHAKDDVDNSDPS